MITIENLDPNTIKIKKSNKNIRIHIVYMTRDSVKLWYLITNNANQYIEWTNGNEIWH